MACRCPQSQGGRPIKPRGLVMGTKRVSYGHKVGRYPRCKGTVYATKRSGILEAARWLCVSLPVKFLSSLGLVLNYVGLRLGNEDRDPQHLQGHHT
jgi:hypothetical protein